MLKTASIAALVALGAQTADAGTLRGRVVSGGAAEATGVEGVWVWTEDMARARTDGDGRFELEVADRAGIVWARTPDGYRPGRAWRRFDDTETEVEIALQPSAASGPLRFVHVADSHIGKKRYGGGVFSGADLEHALAQALAHDPDDPPAFYVMTGDLTNLEKRSELDEAAAVLLDRDVPFVPVPGNHDWVARGRNYRRVFGPANYSFDAGGVHFVVLNDNWRKPPDLAFLEAELETVEGDPTIIAFVHRPPRDAHLEVMDRLGVDVLFTGHWHSNRYVRSGGLWQINTEAIIRGGIDFTPAGYRVVSVEGGELSIVHATITERPEPRLTWPPEGGCVAPGPLEILAAAEPRVVDGPVEVAIDGGAAIPVRHRRGWVWAASAGALASGDHRIALRHGGVEQRPRRFAVCAGPATPSGGAWLQAQGDPGHLGVAARPIEPPLTGLWATAVGEHVLGGSPAIAGGKVLVPMSDLDDGDGGGVVALDLATGAEAWRAITGHSVRGTPAVAGDRVVFNDASGVVHAVDLASGDERWRVDLGAGVDNTQSAQISAPAVDGERAYAVVIGRLAAIDLDSGEIVWENRKVGGGLKANMTSRAAPGLAGDLVVATAGWGKGGLLALDPETGGGRWLRKPRRSEGIQGAPVIAGDSVFVADSWGWARALDRSTGKPRWSRRIAPNGNSLSLSVAATPAVARGVVVIPTQYHSLIALDAGDGRPLWSAEVGRGAVHTAHDERTSAAVTSSPIIAGDLVWFGGVDGVLRAVELETGAAAAAIDLGAPILAGPAPAGDVLVVATYDGVVRAFASAPVSAPRSVWPMVAAMIAVGAAGWWISARGAA